MQSVKSSHSKYQMYLEVQRKLNENEEKLLLEKEKEVVLMKEIGQRNFAKKISKFTEFTKEYMHQVRKYSKGCKCWLAKVLKGNIKGENVVNSHTIIQISLDCKRVLESTLWNLESKKRKLRVSRSH